MQKKEIDDKLNSICLLMKFRESSPIIDGKDILKMVEQILYPDNKWVRDIEVPAEIVDTSTTLVDRNQDFSRRWDWIGRHVQVSSKGRKYQDNPFDVHIGQLVKCTECNQVAIQTLCLDRNKNSHRSYLRREYIHYDHSRHSDNVMTLDGMVDYEDFVRNYEKKKKEMIKA